MKLFMNMPQGCFVLLAGLLILLILVGCRSEPTVQPDQACLPEGRPWKLICLGDGLTAGAGLSPDEMAYPARLSNLLTTTNTEVKVVNAGLKGESLRAAASRLPWMFQQRFDVLLIALGQAELSQAKDLSAWTNDWNALLSKVRSIDPEVTLLVTVLARPVPATTYVEAVQELARKHSAVYLNLPLEPWTREPSYWLRRGGQVFCSPAGQAHLAELLAVHLGEMREQG